MPDDLFSPSLQSRPKPLADRLRPTRIEDILGQGHLLAEGEDLQRRIAEGRLGSIVLYGPPGIGKTSIGRAIANSITKEFRQLNAIDSGVAQVRALIDEGKIKQLVVFIDEIHRFSKSQQDSLLQASEAGYFDLIMATTENPSHNLNAALLSRSKLFILKLLDEGSIRTLITKAANYYRQEGIEPQFEDAATARIVKLANGDGRQAIGLVEDILRKRPAGPFKVTLEMVNKSAATAPILFDKDGDMHYNVTSAFCKSMRGGDEDGTLLWMAVMIEGGVDPVYIARRVFIHASEDVGLADPSALQSAHAAMYAVERIGFPEARIILAQAALHVCRSPKSNSAYRGIHDALAWVKQNGVPQVPKHLCDTHYAGAAALGNVGYKFPHDYEEGWVQQSYLPPGLQTGVFYQSDARQSPTFEQRADGFWDRIRKRVTPKRWNS